jgi:hypothetical protein
MNEFAPNGPGQEVIRRWVNLNQSLRALPNGSDAQDAKGYEAVKELDELMDDQGLLGVECLVSGRGCWTEAVDETAKRRPEERSALEVPGRVKLIKKSGEVAAKACISNGFRYGLFDFDPTNPSLVQEFMLTQDMVRVTTSGLILRYAPVLHLQEASLILPLRDVRGYPMDDDCPSESHN